MVVYEHYRNDTNSVFYVGIGKNKNRAFENTRRNSHWKRVVAKHGHTVKIVSTPESWEDCCKKEKELIAKYGRIDLGTGTLVNMTDGGDGMLGAVISEETRAKRSISLSGKIYSKERIAKISASLKGKKMSDSARAKMSESQKGRVHSEETKAKISASGKGKKKSPEHIAKMSEAMKGKTHSEESKAKMSKSRKGIAFSDEHKVKISIALKGKKKSQKHITNAVAGKKIKKYE